jgi:hypothetical protein
VRTDQPVESIHLIPMGAARLRISSFPVIGGDDAHQWTAPPLPKQLYRASASHCHVSDTVTAIADERVPRKSDDDSIPRHTFWPHKGTTEWLLAEFDEPRSVQSIGVYWFDDEGRGGCRVPKAWRALTKDGDQWKPVELLSNRGFGAAKDQLNRIRIEPRKTSAVRIEVELQPEFSGGVLELIIE